MTRIHRKFRSKDIEMLTALLILIGYLREDLKVLSGYQMTLTTDALTNLEKRVYHCLEVDLNVKNGRLLANSTAIVEKLVADALHILGTVEQMIDMNFKSQPEFIKDVRVKLGFEDYDQRVNSGSDQEGLTTHLMNYKANYPEFDKVFTNKGINPSLSATLSKYAMQLELANVEQESLKVKTPMLTREMIVKFNDIYDTVMDISKLARRVFRNQPERRDRYNFKAIISRMNFKNVTQEEEVEEESNL